MAQKPFAVLPVPFTAYGGVQVVGYPYTNLAEFSHIGMVWQCPTVDGAYVFGDFGSAVTNNYCAVLSTSADSDTTFRMRIGDDPTFASWSFDTGANLVVNPARIEPLGRYHVLYDFGADIAGRYFLIEFFDTGPAPTFEAAKVVFGQKLTFANYYSPGFEFGAEDLGDLELGRWGVPDETPGLIFRRWTGKFGWMSQSDMDTMFRPLVERVGKRKPILFCMDPGAGVYAQARTYFGWLKEPPFFTGAVNKFDRYEMEMSIISMI